MGRPDDGGPDRPAERSSRTRRSRRSRDTPSSSIPETEPEQEAATKRADLRARRDAHARDDPLGPAPARRARLRRDPADHDRGGHPSPHARLGALHARRDAGARHRHPRDLRGHAAHRGPHRGGLRAALHAPLQLPPVLRRRGEALRLARPPRDRARPPRVARHPGGPSRREGVPLRDPGRLRHPRVERLLLDGDDLRRLARPHGRRRPRLRAAVAGVAMGLVKEGRQRSPS